MTGFIIPLQSANPQPLVEADEVSRVSQFHQSSFAFYHLKWRQNILWLAPQANQSTLETIFVQPEAECSMPKRRFQFSSSGSTKKKQSD